MVLSARVIAVTACFPVPSKASAMNLPAVAARLWCFISAYGDEWDDHLEKFSTVPQQWRLSQCGFVEPILRIIKGLVQACNFTA